TRIAQISLDLKGAFWPTSFPLFHGSRPFEVVSRSISISHLRVAEVAPPRSREKSIAEARRSSYRGTRGALQDRRGRSGSNSSRTLPKRPHRGKIHCRPGAAVHERLLWSDRFSLQSSPSRSRRGVSASVSAKAVNGRGREPDLIA